MAETLRLEHPIPPLFGESSTVLILGSFPSVKSREAMFFYGHPQNRFWRLLARLYGEETPVTVEDKKRLILSHNLALWDTIGACTVTGSSDSSIRDVVPNDLGIILNNSRVSRIFCNGATSHRLYQKYLFPKYGLSAAKLPSTSPANAAWTLEKLAEAWRVILADDKAPDAPNRER